MDNHYDYKFILGGLQEIEDGPRIHSSTQSTGAPQPIFLFKPDSLGGLSNLQVLYASGCNSLVQLPSSIQLLSNLERLDIDSAISECQGLSDGNIGEAWTRLKTLELGNCGILAPLLDYGALESLVRLDLCGNTLTELPESFGLLIRLETLKIRCESLQCLPNSIGVLEMIETLELIECHKLESLPETLGALPSLIVLNNHSCPIRRLPKSIGLLSHLECLNITSWEEMQKLPTSFTQLQSLKSFHLEDCGNIEATGALTTLQGLSIWGNTSITKLPASLGIESNFAVYNGTYSEDYSMIWHEDSDDESIREACLNGASCQILEEDESGYLKACQDESSGLIGLLRAPLCKVRFLIMNTPSINFVITSQIV